MGRPFRIIGITPAGFNGLASPFRPSMLWVPAAQVASGASGPIARLKPGVDVATFRAFVAATTPALVRREWEQLRRGAWPWAVYRNRGLSVLRVVDVDNPAAPEARLVSTAVLAAVTLVSSLVLVIACANIAGLLLVRGTSRTGEIAVRQALGAVGARLFRQIATEALLLSGLAALLGVGIAAALVRLFAAVTPATMSVPVSIDARICVFAILAALTTGLLVGLTPALQATRVQLLHALGSGVIGARGTGRSFTRWIVVPQVTLSLVLLLVAAVHVRALRTLETRDPGYRTTGTSVFTISRGNIGLDLWTKGMLQFDQSSIARDRRFAREIVDALNAAPGVDGFALASGLPLATPFGGEITVSGEPSASQATAPSVGAVRIAVSDGYFDVMGMRVIAGRTFDERDRHEESGNRRAAVVSASVARALGAANLVGHMIELPADIGSSPARLEVIGIVNDVDPVLDDGHVHPVVYEALDQQWRPAFGTLLVRGHGDDERLVASVKNVVIGADAASEISRISTLDATVAAILYPRRLAAGLLACAAVVGALLASIGLYGIVSFSAAQRKREFGIRATLGATPISVVALALREGVLVLGLGIGFGLVLGAITLRASAGV
jgi:predicted permease